MDIRLVKECIEHLGFIFSKKQPWIVDPAYVDYYDGIEKTLNKLEAILKTSPSKQFTEPYKVGYSDALTKIISLSAELGREISK